MTVMTVITVTTVKENNLDMKRKISNKITTFSQLTDWINISRVLLNVEVDDFY